MQRSISGALCAVFLACPALAHVTLEQPEAPVGSTYKAVLRIGHGCKGAPTQRLRVTLPEGFYNAKPMPKAGWQLEVIKGDYEKPFDNHGTAMTQGAREIVWSGGELPDDWYDEFTIRGSLGSNLVPGAVLYFPTVQECGKAREKWINVTGNPDAADPAPPLVLTEAKGQGHAHSAAAHDPAPADSVVTQLGDLSISGGFSRATLPGAPVAGGFMTIGNAGGADRLVEVHSALAGRAEIHEMAMEGDVMRMRALPEGVPIPEGATVELAPGGYHLMFMDLKQPFAQGEVVPVTLRFEKAGEVTVPLRVGPPNATADKAGSAAEDNTKGGEHAGH